MKRLLISLIAVAVCCTTLSAQQTKRQLIKKLGSVYELVDEYYVEDTPLEPLVEEAIRATLKSLDPHSHYLSKEEMEASNLRLKGLDTLHHPIVAFRVDSVGYISISTFTKSLSSEFYTAYKALGDVNSLVVDLRDNGGGYVSAAIDLTSLFLCKGDVMLITESKRREIIYDCSRDGVLRDIPLVVIINENTASASEIFAGAIQDHDRGVLVGRTSYGKGLIQKNIEFNDGSGIRITSARYKTPSGRPIQRPYTMGNDDAYHSDSTRYLHPDSIVRADTLKFKTLKRGREVYACGGITPDVYLRVDTLQLTPHLLNSIKNGVAKQSVAEFLTTTTIEAIKQSYPTQYEFCECYQLSSSLLDIFYNKTGYRYSDTTSTDYRYLEAVLLATLAEHLYGIEARCYTYINKFDYVAKKAIGIAKDVKSKGIFIEK